VIAWEYHSPDARSSAVAIWSASPTRSIDRRGSRDPTDAPKAASWFWNLATWDHLVQLAATRSPTYGKPGDLRGRIDINADQRYKPQAGERRDRRKAREASARKSARATRRQRRQRPPRRDRMESASHIEADWLHTNAIDYQADLDLSCSGTPILRAVVIDHSTTTRTRASNSVGRYVHGGENCSTATAIRATTRRRRGRSSSVLHHHNARWLPVKELPSCACWSSTTPRPTAAIGQRVESCCCPSTRTRIFSPTARRPSGLYAYRLELTVDKDCSSSVHLGCLAPAERNTLTPPPQRVCVSRSTPRAMWLWTISA